MRMAVRPAVQEMDADLQELVEQNNADVQQVKEALDLHSWTARQWDEGPDLDDDDFWQMTLSRVREEMPDVEFARLILDEVPQRVAAICVRDYWEELDAPARNWCIETLAQKIPITLDDADFIEPIPGLPFVGNIMNADGFAAYVLPKIVASEPDNTVALESLANAVTHRSEQVVFNASQGIAEYLTVANPDLMLQCTAAIAMKARLLSERAGPWSVPKAEPPANERSRWTSLKKLWRRISRIPSLLRSPVRESTSEHVSISALVRDRLLEGSMDVESELTELDLTSWHGMVARRSVSEILAGVPDSPLSRNFFKRVAYSTVSASRTGDDGFTSVRMEPDKMGSLARFVLHLPFDQALLCCQPLLDAIDEQPDEVAEFLEDLINMEDEAYPRLHVSRIYGRRWPHGLSTRRSWAKLEGV